MIRSQSVVYMRQHGINLQVANGMAQMYTFLPETLPEGTEASKLASVIVNLLATYRAPTSPQQLVGFRRDTGVVAGVLEALWNKSSVASVQVNLYTSIKKQKYRYVFRPHWMDTLNIVRF